MPDFICKGGNDMAKKGTKRPSAQENVPAQYREKSRKGNEDVVIETKK